ncbi:FAS synthase, partial [Pseudoatta argentina]
LIIGGTLQQKISCCLDELDKFLLQSRPIVSSMVVAEKKMKSQGSLIETIADILNISNIKLVSPNSSLAELGMDSMMAIEIKQILEREFDIFVTAQEMRNLTFAKLTKISVPIINDNDKDNDNDNDNVDDEKKLKKETLNVITFFIGVALRDEDFVSPIEFLTNKQNTTTEVLLIPGINGCDSIFKTIIPYIKFSTSWLHYNTNNMDCTNTIMETINRFTNVCNRISNFILR